MEQLQASFRDPSGYVFERDGELYRQILPAGQADFEHFTQSGLAARMMSDGDLAVFVPEAGQSSGAVLKLSRIPYITYPYEWSFSQLRDAGILTLKLMKEAMDHGMVLKDASAFNVAFDHCRPIFLDHTSFEVYEEDTPWRAYRQFVMHFAAPLLLMQKVDLRCLQLLRTDLDGIKLDFTSHLLPWYTKLQINPLLHIHMHALMEQRYSTDRKERPPVKLPKKRLLSLLEGLQSWLADMRFPKQNTEWDRYNGLTSYTQESLDCKCQVVKEFCARYRGHTAVDLGANSGTFSQIATAFFEQVIAVDADSMAVERLYQLGKELHGNLQPVLLDLNNPSSDSGVNNQERQSFFSRTKADAVLGLALIHHLRITCNWSLDKIASLFARIANRALVEFVPLDDIQVRQLTRGRESIYQDWTLEAVRMAFCQYYPSCRVIPLSDSKRILLELTP